MENVTKLYPKNAAENPDNVLEQAIGIYQDVVVIGWDKDGDLDVRASSKFPKSEILWVIELFKHKLMSGDYCE